MLCYVMFCYVLLCFVMLYYVMLCYVMLCYVMYACMYVYIYIYRWLAVSTPLKNMEVSWDDGNNPKAMFQSPPTRINQIGQIGMLPLHLLPTSPLGHWVLDMSPNSW